ncbi:MAG TPA: hypothetical protein EYG85_04920 [Crocinitomix sp.]|nr:hypothetical protein [Crocinitomix sp.]
MLHYLSKFVKQSATAPKTVVDLLSDITIGTNGAKYSHLHTKNKIHTLHQPKFIYLQKNHKAIANVTICKRPIYIRKQPIDSFYIRYFAFKSSLQSRLKSHYKSHPKKGHSFFDEYLKILFSTSNFNVEQPEYNPSLFWAYIDPENQRSFNMGKRFGFETIGYFRTYGFSRFYPIQHKNVKRIQPKEQSLVKQQLLDFYKDHAFYSNVHLFKHNDYFVYKHNGKIVAGVQTYNVHWRIDELPGIKGKIIVKVLPYIPFIRRIINPKSFKFLAVDQLFWKKEYQDKVQILLESVLAIQQKNALLLWLDDADYKMTAMIESLKLGIIQKLKSDNTIEIVAKFNQYNKTQIDEILNTKKYISGFDTT